MLWRTLFLVDTVSGKVSVTGVSNLALSPVPDIRGECPGDQTAGGEPAQLQLYYSICPMNSTSSFLSCLLKYVQCFILT